MSKNPINRIEKEIIRVIIKENRPLTMNQISNISGISWVTVKKYMPKLIEKGVIDELKKKK